MNVIDKQGIASIMTTNLIQLNATDTLYKAKEIFKKYNIRHLPVINDGELVGIVSLTDVESLEYGETFGGENDTIPLVDMLKIYQIMKPAPKTVTPRMSIREVSEMLMKSSFHALPVVDGDDLVGIVTTTDIIKYFINETNEKL
ncbi:MAG: CBS domain-containing protein [Flavobacteriales bacterium]|nr:CBS domain-containing protein [Flavobacteriales bacterium]